MNNGFTLYISDMLQRPVFQKAKLIAGKGGLDRNVSWVHILEITNVAPFVTPNDLILTTGLWLHRVEQERLSYMQQLIDQQAAGLCVELGTSIENIPEEMILLAESHHFPLIVFEQPVRFVEITQDIHGLLINQQHQRLKDLEAFSRKMQQITLQTTDVHAILHVLYEYTGQQIVYHSSVEANKFYPRIGSEAAGQMTQFYRQQVEANEHAAQETAVFPMEQGRILLSQPVICLGQTLAYIGIILPAQKPADTITLLLDYTAKSLASLLLRMLFLEEKMLRDQNQLIHELIHHQVENEESARARMGLRSVKHGEVLFIGGIIELEHEEHGDDEDRDRMESNHQDLLVQLRALLKKNALHHLTMMKDHRIYVLCAKENSSADTGAKLQRTIRKIVEGLTSPGLHNAPPLQLHAGFGQIRQNMTDMDKSFKEAKQVIEVSRSVKTMQGTLFYDRIGIYQVLMAIPDRSVLESFVRGQLDALLAYDREHQLHLVHTLDIYLQCMGSKNDTAKALFIHRQTLYNRLDKLAEILGDDYLAPARRSCLEMALLARRLISYDTME